MLHGRCARAGASASDPLARLVAFAATGCLPEEMGVGPVFAIPKALTAAGLTLDDIDLIELNEAFAAQSLAVLRTLGIDPEKVNVNGGAIALGHPLGCTGAKLTATLLGEDAPRRPLRHGDDVRRRRYGSGWNLREFAVGRSSPFAIRSSLRKIGFAGVSEKRMAKSETQHLRIATRAKISSAIIADRMAKCGSFVVSMGAHAGIGTLPIVYFGTEEQKKKYLPRLAAGEIVGAYALSESIFRFRRHELPDARDIVPGWQALHSEWREDVDHQCRLRRPVYSLRED